MNHTWYGMIVAAYAGEPWVAPNQANDTGEIILPTCDINKYYFFY